MPGSSSRKVRIGIDVGGTFTDLYLLDEARARPVRHKLSSTPADPHQAPIQGIRELLEIAQCSPADVAFVGLGTTVATNALLERKGTTTGLITTAGFRDLLEIARQKRPHLFDLFARKTDPLVPRELRLEVSERVDASGAVVNELDSEGLVRAMTDLTARGVRSVAICFLNSYANPAHEKRAADMILERFAGVDVTSSQDLVPEFREFERLSSTVVNAYLMPTMRGYLTRFRDELRRLGIPDPPFIMTSGGGVVTVDLAIKRPIDLLLSGPSGGVSAAIYHASTAGRPNIVTFDMGGTSTDVCLVQDAKAELAYARSIAGLPIRSASLDIHTVGAGGSSVAWIDTGALLHVGPQSAGANPGPACYGHADAKPTMTDANVVLGRLNQEALLDGRLPIDAARSFSAIERAVASERKTSALEAAAAICAVSNVNIAQAIRHVSVQRGFDTSDFTLVAFGGAGPLHAAAVARELDMEVLVPPGPGVFCAMGVLTKDIELDLSQTRLLRGTLAQCVEPLDRTFSSLESKASSTFSESDLDTASVVFKRSADVRYRGQSFEISVEVPCGALDEHALEAVRASFDAAHRRLYGYDKAGESIEFVTCRLRASLPVTKPALASLGDSRPGQSPTTLARRSTYFETVDAFVDCPVYRRDDLAAGVRIEGPAIVEQMDTTTVIPPDFAAKTDRWGNLILTQRKETAP